MTISNTARDYRKESIKEELGKIKSEMQDVINSIDSIREDKGNLTEGMGFVHKTQRVAELIAHLNRKAMDMQFTLTDYAFIVGIEQGEKGAAQ